MNVRIEHQDGKLPIRILGGRPIGGKIQVSGNVSSQFLSSLLFMTPLLNEDSEIEVFMIEIQDCYWSNLRGIGSKQAFT